MNLLDETTPLLDLARPFRLSRVKYERIVAAGMLGSDDRVELLDGLLASRSPQQAPHASTVHRVGKRLTALIGERAEVLTQLPLALSEDSEPEPDVSVVASGDYRVEHPSRALLVVEVADSSLRQDRRVKGPIYAAASVADY